MLHAADQDLPCLREAGFVCTTLFDTELAGRLLGKPKVNLATMVEEFLGLGAPAGPRRGGLVAASAARRLVGVRRPRRGGAHRTARRDRRALADAGKDQWAREEFTAVLRRPAPAARVDRWRRTGGIHTVKSARGLAAVRELWLAREDVARRRDIAPGRILPDSAIVTAAIADPATVKDLTRLPVFGPRQSRNARTLVRRPSIGRGRCWPPNSHP